MLTLFLGSQVMAQVDALDQVYQAEVAGRFDQAQQMVEQVLRDHPNSARAHFAEAELLTRQGQSIKAREELGLAEYLSPGLPFAKIEAVQNLRHALAAPPGEARRVSSPEMSRTTAGSTAFPWDILVATGAGAFAAWVLMRLGRSA